MGDRTPFGPYESTGRLGAAGPPSLGVNQAELGRGLAEAKRSTSC